MASFIRDIPSYLKTEHTEWQIANFMERRDRVAILKYCVDLARGNLTPKEHEAVRRNAYIIYAKISEGERLHYGLDNVLSNLIAIQSEKLTKEAMKEPAVSIDPFAEFFIQGQGPSGSISSSSRRDHVSHNELAKPKSKEKSEESPRLGMFWDCIEKKQNAAGGNLVVFKLRNDLEEPERRSLISEIFPAEEPYHFREAEQILRNRNFSAQFQFLQQLGYDIRMPDIIVLPDREALMANWHQLQEERRVKNLELPPLPDLTILSSEGIANDRDFVDAYITHGALLSSGKEFVHDHFFHLIPMLLDMQNPDWSKDRAHAVKLVQIAKETVTKLQEHLNNLRDKPNVNGDKIDLRIQQLDTVLGMFTDILAARRLPLTSRSDREAFNDIGCFFEKQLIGVYNGEIGDSGKAWRRFWTHRGYPDLSDHEIVKIVDLLKTPMPEA